ncbi:MarR family winged helix-turn-helix transcriptional regulator [Bacteroides heparinolyticus]|uniref:MarR family winged helix-turn-helix transcriptional regulator n=3 Tax=Bacteroidales TaxID=171549 RepID=UPI0035A0212F
MKYDELKLSNQLCFPIYAASRDIIQNYGKYLDDLDITYPQYLVLMVLWEEDFLPVNAIGKRLLLDSGTLTPLLKRMEAKELITRHRCKQDERIVRISLTEKGKELKAKSNKIPTLMAKEYTLTPEEAETLKKLIYKLINKE